MTLHPVRWPHFDAGWGRRGVVAAFRPVWIALFALPCLLWSAGRVALWMQVSAAKLTARPELGHAVISGVNAALLGIVLVVVLCGAYVVAGWAAGGLLHGLLAWWGVWPKSRLAWAGMLMALAAAWGGLFYGLHSAILTRYSPPGIEALLVWFGLPGLFHAWAAALRQGDVI